MSVTRAALCALALLALTGCRAGQPPLQASWHMIPGSDGAGEVYILLFNSGRERLEVKDVTVNQSCCRPEEGWTLPERAPEAAGGAVLSPIVLAPGDVRVIPVAWLSPNSAAARDYGQRWDCRFPVSLSARVNGKRVDVKGLDVPPSALPLGYEAHCRADRPLKPDKAWEAPSPPRPPVPSLGGCCVDVPDRR